MEGPHASENSAGIEKRNGLRPKLAALSSTVNLHKNANPKQVFGRRKSWADQLADQQTMTEKRVTRKGQDHVKFVNSTLEIIQTQMLKRDDGGKKKRTRTSPEQLRILQKAFQLDPMPNSAARLALAKKLGMNVRAVQVWFQNRRAKGKLEARKGEVTKIESDEDEYEPTEQSKCFRGHLDDDCSPSDESNGTTFEHLRFTPPKFELSAITRHRSLPSLIPDSNMSYLGAELSQSLMNPEFQSSDRKYTENFDFGQVTLISDLGTELLEEEILSPLFLKDPYVNITPNESFDVVSEDFDTKLSLRRCYSSPNVHYYLNSKQIEQLQQFDYQHLDSIEEAEIDFSESESLEDQFLCDQDCC